MIRQFPKAFTTALCLIAAGVTLHASPTGEKTLTPADRKHLLNDKFQTSYTSHALPASVKALYAAPPLNEPPPSGAKMTFPMAEPGKPWNVGDAVQDTSLPFRRLIFVAVSKDYCLVTYERGGIAYSRCASLFHYTGKKADLRWSGNIYGDFKTLHDVRVAIKAHKYRDGGLL
ncbi:MAG: hypothetical protein ABIY70_21895 [Capsulimonas sp.]|uniref:hypothetical protein n=1 Tax=Capsulimonas sp. TaxID=2494211 RepID=UPI0032633318